MNSFYSDIKSRITCTEYMAIQGIEITNPMPCPLPGHQITQRNSPSFSIFNSNDGTELFKCHSTCDRVGDVITLCALMENITVNQAAKKLAVHVGIDIPEESFCGSDYVAQKEPYRITYLREIKSVKALNEIMAKYLDLSCSQKIACPAQWELISKEQEYLIEWHENCQGNEDERWQAIMYLDNLCDCYNAGIVNCQLSLTKSKAELLSGEDSSPEYLAYLARRNISLGTAKEWGLFLAQENRFHEERFNDRLIFPVKDGFGHVTHHTGRDTTGKAKSTYIVQQGGARKKLCYGLDMALESIKATNEAIICEGYIDAVRMHQAGFKHTIATTTANISSYQARILRGHCESCLLILDDDATGRKLTASSIERLIEAGFCEDNILVLDNLFKNFPAKDPDELLTLLGDEDGFNFISQKIRTKKRLKGWKI